MAIFRERLVRSALTAAGVALVAYFITSNVPGTYHMFNLMQSSVAILAIAALAVLVVTHHRQEGRVLTQTQEEMILIGTFGLFWFVVLVSIRAFRQGNTHIGGPTHAGSVQGAATADSGSNRSPGRRGGRRGQPYPCSSDSVYCYVEEWGWY